MPESSFPIGRRITLPGHFVGPVVLESVQPIGDGFECRVSLPDGMSGQTTLSRLEARSILDRRLRLTETSVAVEDQLCKVTIPHQLGRSIIGSAPKADDGPDRKETVVQAKSTRRWIGDTTLVGNSDAQPGREEPPGSRRVGITALPDGPGVAGSHYTTRPDSADHGTAPFNAQTAFATTEPFDRNMAASGQQATSQTIGSPASGRSSRTGRFLGEYEILEEIARGGMGVVYRARQEKLNRLVALKVIRSGTLAGPEDFRRFRQEAAVIAEFDHPNIIPIHEIGQERDQPYFSMKLIESGNLTHHLPRFKADARGAAVLMAKVARAVHYAHQRTILHRDIKPSNILVGERDEPYVTDFGLAKRIGGENGTAATVTGMVMGTPAYMPPEQARGGTKLVTTTADIYSLGATLYEMLTGRAPFIGDSVAEILGQVLNQEPTRLRSINSTVDRDLETICLKCLEKEPSRRYSTAEALADDLQRWLAGMPITARPVALWEKAVKWIRRQPAIATLVIMVPLGLLGLIGGGIWFTLELRQERDMANRGRYASDMNLARRALDDGLIHLAREQLKAYQTGPRALGELRSFEWYYLANLCDRTPIRLRGHEKPVVCVAMHRDGNRVVSGGMDATVRVWDLAGGREIHVFRGKGGSVHSVAFSPDGRWLAAGDEGGGLRIWDLETYEKTSLPGHQISLRSVSFSPDSRHLLSSEASGQVEQRNVVTGEIEFAFRHGDPDENPAKMVVRNGQPIFGGTIAAHTPDGQSIVSVGMDQSVIVWDIATRRPRAHIRAGANLMGFSISPDGRELALAEETPQIEIFDLEHLQNPARIVRGPSYRIGSLAFSPDSDSHRRILAVNAHGASGLVDIDVEKTRIIDLFDNLINYSPFSMAFGPGGHSLALAVGDEVHVIRLDPSLKGVTVAENLGPIRRLAASGDERLLALLRDDGSIIVWDLVAKRRLHTLSGHPLGGFGVAFVTEVRGTWLVSVGGDGLIHIWDPENGGAPLRTLTGHRGAVLALAVRPDGRQIATGGEDGFVRTWDPLTGQAELLPLDHGVSISALAYDKTGASLASGAMDRTVSVWDAASGERTLGPLSHSHQLTSVAFSPDGRLLAGGGGTTDMGGAVSIWNASSGALSTLVKCTRGVNSVSFNSDSRRIATCGSDAVVQVWDVIGGQETLSLGGDGGRVAAVLFSSLNVGLYSAGYDGVVKLWNGSPAMTDK